MKWWEVNKRDLPWRHNPSPYESLIAEIFLRQTRVIVAKRVFKKFIESYPDIKDIIEADTKEMKTIMRPLGLLKRADELKRAAKHIEEELGGAIPPDKRSLMDIPGVGEYTASAILVFGFKDEGILIDTNIERVVQRLFGSSDVNIMREHIKGLKEYFEDYRIFSALLDLGSKVCKAPEPNCDVCPIKNRCSYVM